METNVYTRWEATSFKAHLKVKFSFTDVKRPNAGPVPIKLQRFSSGEKKGDLCLIPLKFCQSQYCLTPLEQKGCRGNIQNTNLGKGPSEGHARLRVVLAFGLVFFPQSVKTQRQGEL